MRSFRQGLDRELTEELGEEKAVALLEGDTLPAQIVRPAFFVPTRAHRIESLPGVLVVGGEASRVGGLGNLAVVDLLEGVEALAGGRQGVHQMHGGGSLVGIEIFGVDMVGDLIVAVGQVACNLSFTLILELDLRRKSGWRGEEDAKILDA